MLIGKKGNKKIGINLNIFFKSKAGKIIHNNTKKGLHLNLH